jgi:hypothetical protein
MVSCVGKSEGKRAFERHRLDGENTKIYLKEIRWDMEKMHLT